MSFLRRLMYGRYGTDQLSLCLLGLYLVLYAVGSIFHLPVLNLIGLVLVVVIFLRSFSRNVTRRLAENRAFLGLFAPLVRWWRTRRAIRRDRDHCYFKCPGCNQRLRVPKGKGRVQITCRACGASFEEKS